MRKKSADRVQMIRETDAERLLYTRRIVDEWIARMAIPKPARRKLIANRIDHKPGRKHRHLLRANSCAISLRNRLWLWHPEAAVAAADQIQALARKMKCLRSILRKKLS